MAQKYLGIITAYGEWLALGNTGSKQDFINSLKSTVPGPAGATGSTGTIGATGATGATGAGVFDTWRTILGNESKTAEDFLSTVGGIVDAPSNNKTHGRKNGTWVEILQGKTYDLDSTVVEDVVVSVESDVPVWKKILRNTEDGTTEETAIAKFMSDGNIDISCDDGEITFGLSQVDGGTW